MESGGHDRFENTTIFLHQRWPNEGFDNIGSVVGHRMSIVFLWPNQACEPKRKSLELEQRERSRFVVSLELTQRDVLVQVVRNSMIHHFPREPNASADVVHERYASR